MQNDDVSAQTDHRLIVETGPARQVAELAEPVLQDMGLRLVRVRITGQGNCTVQLMAERPDGTLTIRECERISRELSPILDVNDPFPGEYVLEVSSPGIDRPLVRAGDFERWAGYEAKIELAELLAGRRKFRGVLEGCEDGEVRLFFDQKTGDGPVLIGLPLDLIADARLVMSDSLIKESLKASRKSSSGDDEKTETDGN